jgi:hypothetical protein
MVRMGETARRRMGEFSKRHVSDTIGEAAKRRMGDAAGVDAPCPEGTKGLSLGFQPQDVLGKDPALQGRQKPYNLCRCGD